MPAAISIRHGDFGRLALIAFDRALVTHAHAQAHLLLKVAGADTEFEVRGRRMPLSTDHAVFVEPWTPHAYPHRPDAPTSLILALYLSDDWMTAKGIAARAPGNSVLLDADAHRTAQRLVASLAEPDLPSGCDEDMIAALIGGLKPRPAAPRVHAIDPRVRRSLIYMAEHLCDRFDIEAVARASGVSRPRFFELFKRDVGVSPAVYWNGLRMESAILATVGGEALTNVSLDLGFSAQSNFTRFFRDIQGVSPSDYRRALRAEPCKQTFG